MMITIKRWPIIFFVVGHSSSVSASSESPRSSGLLPAARGVEGDRHPDEPYDPDDGPAPPDHHRPAQDDERPGGEERDGADATEHERSKPGEDYLDF